MNGNVLVYSFPEGKQLSHVTCPGGLFDVRVNKSTGRELFVCRYTDKGIVRVINLKDNSSLTLEAHKNTQISLIKINNDATMFAIVCQEGKYINLFDATVVAGEKPALVHQFYRGKNSAVVTSISFSKSNSILAVASSSGTVHIFDLRNPSNNPKST